MKAIVRELGINHITRHLFLCADQTKPKCCDQDAGIETWEYLKRRLKELKLDHPHPPEPSSSVFRTKANCLRLCQNGPILLVYPDGIWYRNVTPTVMELIIQKHLLHNQIVEEYVVAHHPLNNHESAERS